MTTQPTELTLSVPDISCGHCKDSIEGAVGGLEGVANVEVTIDSKQVDVTYAAPADHAAIIAAIHDQGYEVA